MPEPACFDQNRGLPPSTPIHQASSSFVEDPLAITA